MTKILLVIALAASLLLVTTGAYAGPYTDPGINGYVDGEVNPVFTAWATACVDYSPAPGVSEDWQHAEKALGEVTGNNGDIVALGDLSQAQIDEGVAPGEITLFFDSGISNGTGDDFAVFENGFMSGSSGKLFAELGFVEVSTDGENFARFESDSLTDAPVGNCGTIDPTDVNNLAGKHPNAYGTSLGTGFDLDELAGHDLIALGLLDLDNINYVKIVDIPGSGDFADADGDPIFDAWVTWGSGGVDLEAVGVIHTASVPLPAAAWLFFSGFIGIAGLNNRNVNKKEINV